jgi:hypothetical protein
VAQTVLILSVIWLRELHRHNHWYDHTLLQLHDKG